MIVSAQDSSYSASDIITLLVVVNEECTGRDELSIIVTVIHTTGEAVLQQQATFTTSIFSLGPISLAVYTCSIFIMKGSQILDIKNISCGNSQGKLCNIIRCVAINYV